MGSASRMKNTEYPASLSWHTALLAVFPPLLGCVLGELPEEVEDRLVAELLAGYRLSALPLSLIHI